MQRLSTSYIFNRTLSGVMENRAKLVDMYEQIASGKQIRKASDDPVLAARILDMQANIANIEQAERYVVTAKGDLSNEESVLSQVQSLVLRARTLMLQGATGTNGAANKVIIGKELNQILEQVGGLSNARNAEGAFIFAGYKADAPAYSFTRNAAGEITSATYDGDNNSVQKTVSPTLKVSVTHPGTQVFSSGASDLFSELVIARDVLYSGLAPTNLAAIDLGFDSITGGLTDIGARMNQVESAQEVNELIKIHSKWLWEKYAIWIYQLL